MRRSGLCMLLLLGAVTVPATAEVRIDLSTERIEWVSGERPAGEVAGLAAVDWRSTRPADGFWFLLWEIDDSGPFAAQTLWAARNERGDELDVEIDVQYYGLQFDLITSEAFAVPDQAVKTRTTRDVTELIDPGQVSRGFVRISPDGPISVDYFQVDQANDFASGGVAFRTDDFCQEWQVRFLRFPGDSSSVLRLLINGPQGGDAMDEPSVVGNIFDEGGNFINSFTIRTDDWILVTEAQDLVVGDVDFGTIVLALEADFAPAGFVTVEHSAFGRFSVGQPAICKDP